MPVKLEGGNRYHYTVKFSSSDIDVSGGIKPWTEAGDNNGTAGESKNPENVKFQLKIGRIM